MVCGRQLFDLYVNNLLHIFFSYQYVGEPKLLYLMVFRFLIRKIMVVMESIVSGYKFNCIRPRLNDKLEFIAYDPYSKFHNDVIVSVVMW